MLSFYKFALVISADTRVYIVHILYILYTYIIRIVQSIILHPSLVGLMILYIQLLYFCITHSHPHYRILMGHSVSFLPHLLRHPPSLLRPYTPHLPTRHSKSPLVMNNSQQFLLDFTHTHKQSTNIHMYVVCMSWEV